MDLNLLLANGESPITRSLPKQVARKLGTRIVSGELPAGSLLPNEKSLCEQLGVSRTVVREAIKLLSSKGLIQVRPGDGTRVLDESFWELLDHDVLAWQFEAGTSSDNFADLIELRLMFEPSASELAARRATNEALKRISVALQKMRDTVGIANSFVLADAEFHLSILDACGNTYLRALSPLIYAGLLSSISTTNSSIEQNLTSLPFHEAVERAIVSRDTAGARDAMLTLLRDASARLG